MRFAILLDGPICADCPSPYEVRKPVPDIVKVVKELFDAGHEIEIRVSRPLKYAKATAAWLGKYGIPCTNLAFELSSDVYVGNDRYCRADEFIGKAKDMLEKEKKYRNAGGLSALRRKTLARANDNQPVVPAQVVGGVGSGVTGATP